MIYRRPSHSRQQFVFRVIGAGTGAVLVGAACKFEIAPSPSADDADATEDVQFSSSGSGAGGGFISGRISGSASGGIGSSSGSTCSGFCGKYASSSGSSSGVRGDASSCESGSSGACHLILYDATDDVVENLETGLHEEAAVTDGSKDGAAETGDP
jgi:hypothetical protein